VRDFSLTYVEDFSVVPHLAGLFEMTAKLFLEEFMKFFKFFLLTFFLVSLVSVYAVSENTTATVTSEITEQTDEEPTDLIVIDGMGYFLLSDVIKDYNAKFEMDIEPKTKVQQVILFFKKGTVVFTENSDIVIIKGIKRKMNKKFMKHENKYVVPLEVLLTQAYAEVSGCTTTWDRSKNVYEINNPEIIEYHEQQQTK
jgi:hypothetical protein